MEVFNSQPWKVSYYKGKIESLGPAEISSAPGNKLARKYRYIKLNEGGSQKTITNVAVYINCDTEIIEGEECAIYIIEHILDESKSAVLAVKNKNGTNNDLQNFIDHMLIYKEYSRLLAKADKAKARYYIFGGLVLTLTFVLAPGGIPAMIAGLVIIRKTNKSIAALQATIDQLPKHSEFDEILLK